MSSISPLRPLLAFGRALRRRVVRALSDKAAHARSGRSAGDVQYRIDRASEEAIEDLAARSLRSFGAFRLLTEGLPPSGVVIGRGPPKFRVLVDPIDGTRGLMYGKRSAFVLVGVAPESAAPKLSDVVAAVMLEIPPKDGARASFVACAEEGKGARIFREGLSTPIGKPPPRGVRPTPSLATTLAHGFATFCRYFDGAQDRIGALAEAFFEQAAAPGERGHVFEDQYLSTAGLMFGLLTGKDRFVADLRPLFKDRSGRPLLSAHPYDLLAAPILREAGVPLLDPRGLPLDAPLDVVSDVAWVGYANAKLRRRYEAALLSAIDGAERAPSRNVKSSRRARRGGRTSS
jgi:hypothetical protein